MSAKNNEGSRLGKSRRFEDLVKIMDILLGKNGCPWDRR